MSGFSPAGGFTWGHLRGLCALAGVGRERGRPVLGTWHHTDPGSWQPILAKIRSAFPVCCCCGMGDLALEVLVVEMLLGRILVRAGLDDASVNTDLGEVGVCRMVALALAFLAEHTGFLFSGGWTRR